MWENYDLVGNIGVGSYSQVVKVRRQIDNKISACKVISLKPKDNVKHAQKAYTVLTQLENSNILGYEDFQQTPKQMKLFMEFCPRGTLQDLVDDNKSYSTQVEEDLIWQMINQLGSALQYCHFGVEPAGKPLMGLWQAIIHKNIKPVNVYVITMEQDSIVVKLGDFSLSILQDSTNSLNVFAGTSYYQAPEITRSVSPYWTKACDIYSLGCTLYTVGALSPPFLLYMDEDDVNPELPDFYSKRLRDCILDCQAFQPEHRHDASDLVWISSSACKRTPTPGEPGLSHQDGQSSQSTSLYPENTAVPPPSQQKSPASAPPARKELEVLSKSDVLWARWAELSADEQVLSASELLPEFETSLGVCERLFGAEHDKTVEALGRLEQLYFRQSETLKAEISQATAQQATTS